MGIKPLGLELIGNPKEFREILFYYFKLKEKERTENYIILRFALMLNVNLETFDKKLKDLFSVYSKENF